LSSIHAAHEFLARRAAHGALRLAQTHLGEPPHPAPLLFSFLHPTGAAAPVQHVRNVTQHVQHLHLLQQFIHRLTLRVEQHGPPPHATRSRGPARMTVLREHLVETRGSMRDGTVRRDIERWIHDRFAERDVERLIEDRRAQRDIERLMRIRFATRSIERSMQLRFARQNTERLIQMHLAKRNFERLMQTGSTRKNIERLTQARLARLTSERLVQVRFPKVNTERPTPARFIEQTIDRLTRMHVARQHTIRLSLAPLAGMDREGLTQVRIAPPNAARVTLNHVADRTFERLTRDRFTRLDFERLMHVRRAARAVQRLMSDRSTQPRAATVVLQTVVAPLLTDTSTTVLQRYGTIQPQAPTPAFALRHAPQAQAGEIKREIERIERTVQTKVVREILHQGHQQQHIRMAVSDALLSPKLVQALARQIHTTLEQRANVERYRKGAR
jgi:hypothetical protein